ncbi:MAG: DNA-formamidopyrimidine glycosylase family protein [Candidatus Njordarchaeales archaeon]
MTEGPSAHYKALRIYQEVGAKVLENILVRSKRVLVDPQYITGKRLEATDAWGKNILLFFDSFAIRVHLMLYGTIHIYGINEPLAKPERLVRLALYFSDKKVVVYNAPIIEINYKHRIIEELKNSLGEDPLRKDWNFSRAVKLILKHKNRKIGDVLLDQGVIAGIGNILRNEILFRARVHPERLVKDLSYEEIRNIVRIAKELSEEFLQRRLRGERIGPILFVYNKSGKPCPVCGEKIRYYRQEPNNRRTFFCPNCQK